MGTAGRENFNGSCTFVYIRNQILRTYLLQINSKQSTHVYVKKWKLFCHEIKMIQDEFNLKEYKYASISNYTFVANQSSLVSRKWIFVNSE